MKLQIINSKVGKRTKDFYERKETNKPGKVLNFSTGKQNFKSTVWICENISLSECQKGNI